MKKFRRVKAAIIGCGTISERYLKTISEKFHVIELVGCSDLVPERSEKRAKEFNICQMTNDEILSNPEIEIVINTTYPLAHYEVTKKALLAGKHVYSEKMLAVTLDEGKELVDLAHERNLLFTVAPDTFLGGGWQTVRYLIDGGVIGDIVSTYGVCVRSYQDHGEEYQEPKGFIFGRGGGIPFDMGGYYLHNMINLCGPVSRVSGFAQIRRPQRPYTNPRHPKFLKEFEVESPNSISCALEFSNEVLGTLLITSESACFEKPRFEIHGTIGNIILFDPNEFGPSETGGELQLSLNNGAYDGPQNVPIMFPFSEENRGIGVADMAYALLNGRKPRACASLGYHSFEVINGICKSCEDGIVYKMQSTCERPEPLKTKPLDGTAWETILND